MSATCSKHHPRLLCDTPETSSILKILEQFIDATRACDLDDIRSLLKIHHASLNMDEVREYFALFNKPELLNELLG